jgi:hypothetical protein
MRARPALLFTVLVAAGLLCTATGSPLQTGEPVRRTGHETLSVTALYRDSIQPLTPTHTLELVFAYFPDAGWSPEVLIDAARAATGILRQCEILVSALTLHRLEGDTRFHYYATSRSRELARRLPLQRPTVYFIAETLQRPAFDAEAIGRGNSKTRPELADTVWITRNARDLALVVVHELAHVLMDSGEHVEEPGNLMRAETAPENTRLDAAQCARLRDTAVAHGLLHPTEKAK